MKTICHRRNPLPSRVSKPFWRMLFRNSLLAIVALAWPGGGLHANSVIDLTKPVASSIKPDGLYWSFDGGTIDDWMPDPVDDLSGNGYAGYLLAGGKKPQPTYVAGKFGTAIGIQGNTPPETMDDGSTVTFQNPRITWKTYNAPAGQDTSQIDMHDKSFTAGVWIKLDKINSGEVQTIRLLHRGQAESVWSLDLRKGEDDLWKLASNMSGFQTAFNSTAQSDALNDGQWHHLAFSFRKEDSSGTVVFWIDGVQIGDEVTSEGRLPETQPKDRIFTLGESNTGSFPTGFEGALDDLFVTSGVYTFKN